MNPHKPLSLTGAAFIALSGCVVGPNHQAPPPDELAPPSFIAATPHGTVDVEALATWWHTFGDNELTTLVERAFEQSYTLKEARERIVEARARRGIANADRLPALDAESSYTRAMTGDDGFVLGGAPPGSEVDIYSLGVVAGWEIDLWGRVARLVEAAEAEIDLAVEDYTAARVALAAEVGREWLTIRAFSAELAIVASTLQADRASVEITQARARAGLSDELDRSRAQRVLDSNTAIVPELLAARRDAEIRLAVLLGTDVTQVDVNGDTLPLAKPSPRVGVPADLLLRRPDLRRSERDLAAANARIGAAIADYFPRVSLSGSFALQGPDVEDIINPDAFILNVSPTVSVPVFDGNRIRSNVEVTESEHRQALLRLRQAVAEAVGEVESAASRGNQLRERVGALANAEAAAQDTVDLAIRRYEAGVVDFLDVTEARSQLFVIQRQLTQARRDALTATIDLYTALGGGWSLGTTAADSSERQRRPADDPNRHFKHHDGSRLAAGGTS